MAICVHRQRCRRRRRRRRLLPLGWCLFKACCQTVYAKYSAGYLPVRLMQRARAGDWQNIHAQAEV